jgi:glycine C-acetyltransferase/8-amino-7-oxononanoate synthase
MDACERALGQGVFCQAIRPPTVPEGSSRLRIAVMASHTRSELRWAAGVLARAVRAAGGAAAEPAREAPAAPRRSGVFDGLAEAA